MGASSTKLEKALGDQIPEGEHYFGLENFGNTCYCNSVLQALYFCVPFRERVLSRVPKDGLEDNLLECLVDLFMQINTQKRKTGVVAPKRFIARVKKDNELFRSFMHQDAHEFLNFLLNTCCDILENEEATRRRTANPGQTLPPIKTWVHDIFQGTLVNQTRCLWCETVTSRDEPFLDLSLELEHNTSISACLKHFSGVEMLESKNKFFCDKCGGLQEAQKRMLVKESPPVLLLHLKRFKYIETVGRYQKLLHRVVFPNEMRLCNTTDDAPCAEFAYNLFAVVVHVGSGPNHGHYVSVVKSHNHWLYFDDESVEPIDESMLQTFFGSTQEFSGNTDHGYILFYERENGPLVAGSGAGGGGGVGSSPLVVPAAPPAFMQAAAVAAGVGA